MALNDVLTKKQAQAFKSYLTDDWRTLILSGAVRAGKTYIDNLIFTDELRRVRNLARKKVTITRNTFLPATVLTRSMTT